ncbi:MAG: redoxin domain-containing protein [Bacteroidota bacterium]
MTKLMYTTFFAVLFSSVLLSVPALAQKVDSVNDFALTDGEKVVKLSDFKDQKLVAVVFTSSHCSWAKKYEDRLIELHSKYAEKEVAFIAVNSNNAAMNELDDPSVMRTVTVFPFPYLKDADQSVAKLFQAKKNPEVFLLKPAGASFKVVYSGKIDDNPLDAKLVKQNFLQDAIEISLEGGNPAVKHSPASGCLIKSIDTATR